MFDTAVMMYWLCLWILSDIDIIDIHNADYRCIICKISKSEAIMLMQNVDLTEKGGAS